MIFFKHVLDAVSIVLKSTFCACYVALEIQKNTSRFPPSMQHSEVAKLKLCQKFLCFESLISSIRPHIKKTSTNFTRIRMRLRIFKEKKFLNDQLLYVLVQLLSIFVSFQKTIISAQYRTLKKQLRANFSQANGYF